MNIGKNIQHFREAKGLTQTEVANILGLKMVTYSRIEKRGDKVDFGQMLKICKALDISVLDLMRGEKDEITTELEKNLAEIESKLSQSEKQSSMLIANFLDYINSAVEQKFCLSYFQKTGIKKIFEELSFAELEEIYQNELANDYIVYFGLKRGFVMNHSLNEIHHQLMATIEEKIKTQNKKFSDFIKINTFLP